MTSASCLVPSGPEKPPQNSPIPKKHPDPKELPSEMQKERRHVAAGGCGGTCEQREGISHCSESWHICRWQELSVGTAPARLLGRIKDRALGGFLGVFFAGGSFSRGRGRRGRQHKGARLKMVTSG